MKSADCLNAGLHGQIGQKTLKFIGDSKALENLERLQSDQRP